VDPFLSREPRSALTTLQRHVSSNSRHVDENDNDRDTTASQQEMQRSLGEATWGGRGCVGEEQTII